MANKNVLVRTQMQHALIFTDNQYQEQRLGILRSPGAHRIATHLRTNHNIQTQVVDFFLDWTLDEIKLVIDHQLTKPTLFIAFGCSLMFDGVTEFSELRDYIKKINPSVSIIVGGNKTLQKGFDQADYYIEGTGEGAISALVEHLLDNKKPLKYQMQEGNTIIDGRTQYPVASMHGLDIKYQKSDFIGKDEVLGLETARGCIFKCAFCDFPGIGKKKLDYLRDQKELTEELLKNFKDHGTTKYIVTEDTVNDTDQKCEMLADIASHLPFQLQLMGYMRADLLISKPKNLDNLMKAGWKGMHFGLETFNERAGRIIGKGMEPNKMKEGLIDIKKRYPNLNITSTFIVGLPYDTREEILESLEWIIQSKALDFWSYNPLVIPTKDPNVKHSYFTDNYLMYGYQNLSKKQVDEEREKLDNVVKYALAWWKNIIYWKNENFNYFTAIDFVSEISRKSYAHRKIDGWSAFAMSGLGENLDNIFAKSYNGDNKIDTEEQIRLVNQYITNYKRKKTDYYKTHMLIDNNGRD